MPAKKAPAPKAPAKPASKAPVKPAPQALVKVVKSASKPAVKAPVKASKPAPKKYPLPVKKTPAKSDSQPDTDAKKPAAKAEAVPAKKAAAAKEAVKAAAPVKKEKDAPAPATAPAPAKKESPAAPVKAAAAKAAPTGPVAKATGKPAGPAVKIATVRRVTRIEDEGITMDGPPKKPVLPAAFLKKQRQRLVELRDAYLNSAEGVAADSLRNEGGDSSAFGMHQADAGSDAYDRDFALSLLAKEQDAIYEINEALKRIDSGMYGICEMSGETISEERLEALPFTRFTVICQARLESEQRGGRWNRPVRSLFGLDESAEDADDDRDEEETTTTTSNSNESLDFSKE